MTEIIEILTSFSKRILALALAVLPFYGQCSTTNQKAMSTLEVFPQSITLYPADTQRFTVRGNPPPSGWRVPTNGTVQSDNSLLYSGSGGNVRGSGLHQLENGIGRVTITVTPESLPTTGGDLTGYFFDAGSGAQMWFEAEPTQILVKKLPTLTTIATVSHTLATGDELALEIAGDRWRFYLNGVEEAAFTPPAANRYPGVYTFDLTLPVSSGTATIPPPVLSGTGEWSIASAAWTATGGSIGSPGTVKYVDYVTGTVPGVYAVTATIESDPQTAFATVIIPPLSILSESSVELQPGEVVTLKTNYDAAQTSLVTWSVVSGSGSFSANQFTAGTAPGDTVVKAVYGNQEARITITVPAVMTITVSSEEVAAATPGEVLTLTTNMTGTINWTASTGTLSASSGATVTWTAPSQAGLDALIVATNGTYTVSATIPVLNAFPYRPNLPLKWERKKTVLVSQSEDKRGRATRVKNYNNTPFESHEFTFLNRNLAELSAAQDFWDAHYPNKRFILTESHRGIRLVLWPDSDIGFDASATCATTYTFRAIEG